MPVAIVGHPPSDPDTRTLGHDAPTVPFLSPANPGDAAFCERLVSLSPELFILAGYGPIVPAATLALPGRGTINLHAGKLPEYRGSSPLNWALINGEDSFTLSVIKADAGVDTGEVLVEQTFPIGPNDGIARLHEITNDAFPRMMLQAVRDIRDGRGRGRVQDRAASRYWPLRFSDDGAILFDRLTAREIHNRIRALTVPYPCAFTAFNGRKVNLLRSALAQSDIRGEPGRIYRISDSRLLVGAADRCLWLTEAVFADTEQPLAAIARRYDRLATVSEAAMRTLLDGGS